MTCGKCKHYVNGLPFSNECKLIGMEFFKPYIKKCPLIDDDYNLTKYGMEMNEII